MATTSDGTIEWKLLDYKGNLLSRGTRIARTVTINHPNSAKRVKPLVLNLSSGTPLSRSREVRSGAVCGVFQKSSSENIAYTTIEDHAYLDPDFGYYGALRTIDIAPLLNRIRKSIRDQNVALGVMMAEYKKTAVTVGSVLNVVAAVVATAVTKHPHLPRFNPATGTVKGVARLTKKQTNKLTSAHLEFVYGVLPLIGDINDAAATLAAIAKGRTVYVRARASDSLSYNLSTLNTSQHFYFNPQKVIKDTYATRRLLVIAEAAYSVHPVYDALFRAGLANPASVAWELIPFSFICDWFVNVGDVLASLDNLGLYGSSITYITVDRTHVVSNTNFRGGCGRYVKKSYDRSGPMSMSTVSTFSYKKSSSVTHITNGVSLILNALTGKR